MLVFSKPVLYREGDTLHTIEGNCNKVVSRSKSHYYIKDGKLFKGQWGRKIAHAFHLFDLPGKGKRKK